MAKLALADEKTCSFRVGDGGCGALSVEGLANVCEYHIYWTTKNGDKIPIPEMDEGHFRNALAMMLRRATMSYWCKSTEFFGWAMRAEGRRRGLWTDGDDLADRLLGPRVYEHEKWFRNVKSFGAIVLPPYISRLRIGVL